MRLQFILYLSFIVLFSCSSHIVDIEEPIKSIEQLKTTKSYKQIDGIDPNLLELDIYYQSNIDQKKPVVIYVHGGGWCIGDKSKQLDNKVRLFESLNYVFVSINYRLSPFPYEVNNPSRLMYPYHNKDVASAIKWIFDHIEDYGGDHNKMALLGHSAGAHLVALTGTNPKFLKEVGLSFAAIKGIAVIDTEGYNVVKKITNNELYINAFGNNPDIHKDASPLLNIKEEIKYPAFFIAKRGSSIRLQNANEFISALEKVETPVDQVDGSIYSHSEINNAIGEKSESLVTEPLIAFFSKCFE